MNINFSWAVKMIISYGYLMCVFCGVAASDKLGTSPNNSIIKVFILAGQSNAVGYNHIKEHKGNAEKLQKEIHKLTNVTFWPGSNAKSEMANKWVNLQIGVSGIAQEEQFRDSCFGPEIGFCISLTKSWPEKKIAIIKYAEGATGIARSKDYHDFKLGFELFDDKGRNWYPSAKDNGLGLLYSNLLTNINDALSALRQDKRRFEISGFIWMQGEHEAGISKKMAEDYGTLLSLFCEAIRKDLNLIELPFVIGEINSHTWEYGTIARKQQSEACKNVPHSILIKTTDLPRGGVGGEAHFTADGTLKLGDRFAQGMLQLLKDKTKYTQTAH